MGGEFEQLYRAVAQQIFIVERALHFADFFLVSEIV